MLALLVRARLLPQQAPRLPLIQARTAYGYKKFVTVWKKMNGQKIQVDIRDAGKSKYSRTPLDPSEPHQPSIEIRRKKGPKLKGRDADGADVQISKTLAWLLRHAADRESLGMRPDGYVRVQDLLNNPRMRGLDFIKLEAIVKANDKQRFSLLFEPDPEAGGPAIWWIRANQGHSLKPVRLDLEEITSAAAVPMAVHGTTSQAWRSIAKQGLSKMKRQHIHLAQGVPGDKVISGMRKSSQILIYIDLPKALDAGIKFYLSSNGVVLTEGDERGFLSPEFFLRVENAAAQSVAFTTAAADTDAPTAPTASSSSTTTTIATESSSDALVEEVAGMQVQQ